MAIRRESDDNLSPDSDPFAKFEEELKELKNRPLPENLAQKPNADTPEQRAEQDPPKKPARDREPPQQIINAALDPSADKNTGPQEGGPYIMPGTFSQQNDVLHALESGTLTGGHIGGVTGANGTNDIYGTEEQKEKERRESAWYYGTIAAAQTIQQASQALYNQMLSTLDKQHTEAKTELETAQKEFDAAKADVAAAEADLQETKARVEPQIAALKEEKQVLETRQAEINNEIVSTEGKIAQTSQQLETEQEKLASLENDQEQAAKELTAFEGDAAARKTSIETAQAYAQEASKDNIKYYVHDEGMDFEYVVYKDAETGGYYYYGAAVDADGNSTMKKHTIRDSETLESIRQQEAEGKVFGTEETEVAETQLAQAVNADVFGLMDARLKVADAEAAVTEQRGVVEKLSGELAQLQQELDGLKAKAAEVGADIDKINAQIESLQNEITEKEQILAEKQAILEQKEEVRDMAASRVNAIETLQDRLENDPALKEKYENGTITKAELESLTAGLDERDRAVLQADIDQWEAKTQELRHNGPAQSVEPVAPAAEPVTAATAAPETGAIPPQYAHTPPEPVTAVTETAAEPAETTAQTATTEPMTTAAETVAGTATQENVQELNLKPDLAYMEAAEKVSAQIERGTITEERLQYALAEASPEVQAKIRDALERQGIEIEQSPGPQPRPADNTLEPAANMTYSLHNRPPQIVAPVGASGPIPTLEETYPSFASMLDNEERTAAAQEGRPVSNWVYEQTEQNNVITQSFRELAMTFERLTGMDLNNDGTIGRRGPDFTIGANDELYNPLRQVAGNDPSTMRTGPGGWNA